MAASLLGIVSIFQAGGRNAAEIFFFFIKVYLQASSGETPIPTAKESGRVGVLNVQSPK